MALPVFSMSRLLEAGVHFGHVSRKWNPKMGKYIFGIRNGVHIIDLGQTVPMLQKALEVVEEVVSHNGRVLFVGTKIQAAERIREAAERCGQYHVNHRWLGGMLTNWKTISRSIKRLNDVENIIATPGLLTKKEVLKLEREKSKLSLVVGGIRNMGGIPDILIIIDVVKENIAVKEASKLGIPVVAVVDSNSCPDDVTYPIPGNDDASKAIQLYCDLFSGAVLSGLEKVLMLSGKDIKDINESKYRNMLENTMRTEEECFEFLKEREREIT